MSHDRGCPCGKELGEYQDCRLPDCYKKPNGKQKDLSFEALAEDTSHAVDIFSFYEDMLPEVKYVRPDWMFQDTRFVSYGACFESGSRTICDPAPVDTDYDVVYFYPNDLKPVIEHLEAYGFTRELRHTCVYENMDGRFTSLRMGQTNIILTDEVLFFNQTLRATRLAKKFNLTSKEDRILLFQSIKNPPTT